MTESTANNGTVFHTHRLKNGLQIVGQPMPDFESVAVSYYVRTGSRDERHECRMAMHGANGVCLR